jgi:arylsulfatase A-like enzyme
MQIKRCSFAIVALAWVAVWGANSANAQPQKKPNILVIFGDDIGWFNVSAYNMGMMGYRTPNIDRIAREGMLFTSYYAQQSCTAGRAAFLTGQSPLRTGLLKVGLPGAKEGIQKEDPTIADLLKPLGYVSGQFGKNHLGDRDEHLPTVHGFDEFFGNLYHLNAEEEPEHPDYPKDPGFKQKFGPRGVLHSYANANGTQRIEDTGPLTKKRMETVDKEFLDASLAFIDKAHSQDKPFFVWLNTTRMHIWTHLAPEFLNQSGRGVYADGMMEHDATVGAALKKLDDLGIADNTIVVYATDNGAEIMFWPDGGMTPFHGEKATGWEGGFRVPCLVRWPGHIKPGEKSSEIVAGEDWLPTLLAAAGEPNVKEKLLHGMKAGNSTFKVHLDGYNLLPYLTGKEAASPRKEFFYFSDDGNLLAMRYQRWKLHFSIQEHHGFEVWSRGFTNLRVPLIIDIEADPFERTWEDSELYRQWQTEHVFLLVPAQAFAAKFLSSFKEFPQRFKPASFNLDKIVEQMASASRE